MDTVTESNLYKVLAAGHFAVTGELGPPQSADASVIERKVKLLAGNVDAANVTDNQTAVVRMSSISVGTMMVNLGLEPIIQMTCRDRNRIAIQSDLLGAHALGIRNLLCLTGDHQSFGNHPQSRNVFDMDSVQLLQMVREMGNGHFQSGDPLKGIAPQFFLGAAANPFGDPFDYRPYRLARKVAAGAQFIQTQLIYDVPKFAEYMKRAVDMGLHEKVKILAGVGPIRTAGAARYMATQVPGLSVPQEYVNRMRSATKGLPREKRAARREAWAKEGINICVEIIQQVREIPGVAGIHIMAIEWEEAIASVCAQAGLLPRPILD